jgi:hypothetical protein
MGTDPKELARDRYTQELREEAQRMREVIDRWERLNSGGSPPGPPVAPPVATGDNGDMEARVQALEDFASAAKDRLSRIESRLDTFASKEDLHKELHAQTWKFITACTILTGVVFWIARYVN